MKRPALALLSLIAFVATMSSHAIACEKHEHHAALASTKAPLPSGSLYQLGSSWTNQDGKKRTLDQLAGRPRLVAMVFTRCKTACPMLVQQMKTLEASLSPEDREHLSVDLFSFDSDRETSASLKSFAKNYKIDEDRWSVYASKSSQVSELAAALGVQYKKLDSGDFVHANLIFLLNDKGEVVAKQEGLNSRDESFVTAVRETIKASHFK